MDAKRRWAANGSAPASGPPPKRRPQDSQDDDARLESFELDAEDQDQRLGEEDLEFEFGEAGQNWERPSAPLLDCENEAMCKPICLNVPATSQTAVH